LYEVMGLIWSIWTITCKTTLTRSFLFGDGITPWERVISCPRKLYYKDYAYDSGLKDLEMRQKILSMDEEGYISWDQLDYKETYRHHNCLFYADLIPKVTSYLTQL
jgi:hypothetical protein